jgi:tRNA nucleotidyltransferase (CCA-adding enzyme)
MNALVYNDDEGIIDLYGGKKDIKSKVIKAIGDPKKRFEEDALRILRGVRFASQLGCSGAFLLFSEAEDLSSLFTRIRKEKIL